MPTMSNKCFIEWNFFGTEEVFCKAFISPTFFFYIQYAFLADIQIIPTRHFSMHWGVDKVSPELFKTLILMLLEAKQSDVRGQD